MCPVCSATFRFSAQTGEKEQFGDHYIVPNTADLSTVKETALEWLTRLNHNPEQTTNEYFVTEMRGYSIPYWVVSLEAHTVWRGLASRKNTRILNPHEANNYLIEKGQFRRDYRWAVCARQNICEQWGTSRLHEPQETVFVNWDGFPLDSTFSRGRLTTAEHAKSVYDSREVFEFKYSNGLQILGVEIDDEEALRRARNHIDRYHHDIAALHVDYLIDYRSELDIAGIQLIHLPFWNIKYVYQPKSALKYFYVPKEKHILIEGHSRGILKGELALVRKDKIWVNAIVAALFGIVFFVLGAAWNAAFFFVALFALFVAAASAYVGATRAQKQDAQSMLLNAKGKAANGASAHASVSLS